MTQSQALEQRAKRLLSDHQRRAKKAGQVLDYDLDHIRQLIDGSPCCRWCRLPVAFDQLSLDHVHPLARGGSYCFFNLCLACRRCNTLRGRLTEAETLELLEFLAGLHPAAREDIERRLLAGGRGYAGGRSAR
ncbi:MAG TPA: HNH endonuclease [Gemmataceae bacterium]|nr:HNH endonuclease [Gemmataceae bacterium]